MTVLQAPFFSVLQNARTKILNTLTEIKRKLNFLVTWEFCSLPSQTTWHAEYNETRLKVRLEVQFECTGNN